MTKPERVILWCTIAATALIILFPPFCQIDAFDNGHTQYCFLFRLPSLDSGTFLWPVTLLLMIVEWLPIVALAFAAYRIAKQVKKPEVVSLP